MHRIFRNAERHNITTRWCTSTLFTWHKKLVEDIWSYINLVEDIWSYIEHLVLPDVDTFARHLYETIQWFTWKKQPHFLLVSSHNSWICRIAPSLSFESKLCTQTHLRIIFNRLTLSCINLRLFIFSFLRIRYYKMNKESTLWICVNVNGSIRVESRWI